MLVNLACDWGRPSRNWPCAWTQSDYCRFLLSIPRNRFLSTDLQSAFWKRFGKEPSFGFPMDLTNLHALLNDQKGGLSKRIDFASTRIQAAKYTSLLPYGRIGDVPSAIARCVCLDSNQLHLAAGLRFTVEQPAGRSGKWGPCRISGGYDPART